MATESLIDTLLNSAPDNTGVMELPLTEGDRSLLATILMKEEEELTPERVEGAVRALRRIQFRRKLEQTQLELQSTRDPGRVQTLLQEKMRLKKALMDPGVAETGIESDQFSLSERKKIS